MKDHKAKCIKLQKKQQGIDNVYTKQEGRTKLLGNQWF